MSRKLMLSSIAIAATATLLGAGTFARFTDSEQSATATVTAGTLNLEVGGSATTTNFSLDNAAPGSASEGLNGFVLSNTGSLPGELHVFLVKDSDLENSLAEPETDSPDIDPAGGEIDSFINITVDGNTFGFGGSVSWLGLADAAVGTPIDVTSLIWGPHPIIIPAGGHYPDALPELWFGWQISPDATNAIMSDSLGFHVAFTLDQV